MAAAACARRAPPSAVPQPPPPRCPTLPSRRTILFPIDLPCARRHAEKMPWRLLQQEIKLARVLVRSGGDQKEEEEIHDRGYIQRPRHHPPCCRTRSPQPVPPQSTLVCSSKDRISNSRRKQRRVNLNGVYPLPEDSPSPATIVFKCYRRVY